MKQMEIKITVTFAIMFVVGIIINGIYDVTSTNSNFFTLEVVAKGFVMALIYLAYIWINTRRHQMLATLGIFSCCCLALMLKRNSFEELVFSGWNWYSTIVCIYYVIAYPIARYQGEKLLIEGLQMLNIGFVVNNEENDENDEDDEDDEK